MINSATEKQVDIQYVGRIHLSEPVLDHHGTFISMDFQGGEWTENSGLCYSRCSSEILGSRIVLKVWISVCSDESDEPMIAIKRPVSGVYDLVFEDPDGTRHLVSKIDFGK